MTNIETLAQNISIYWLAAGALFILLEALAIPGIGFLFAGLAAITTGGLIEFSILPADKYILHTAVFLAASFAWAGILWVPMQHFHKKNKTEGFANMVGDIAIVCNGALVKGKTGEAKWSGTIMQAMLSENSRVEKLEEGQQVRILEVKGNILVVELE